MKRLLYISTFCAIAGYCNAQTFKPALNLAKGSIYYLSTNANSTIMQTVSGQQNTVNMALGSRMAFKVINIVDTVYDMEVSYQSLSMKMDLAGIDIDSKKNDPQDTLSTVITAMMNKPFGMKITQTGKVRSVTNIDAIIGGALNGVSQIGAVRKEQIRELLIQSFGPAALKGGLETGTAIFPGTPVAKEGRWTVITQLESPVKATVNINYQLIDVAEGLYLIHGDGTIASDKDAASQQINSLPVKYNLNGSVISDIRVDKATGWVTEIKMKQIMMGDMQILDNPKLPGGMRIPISFNTDVITTNK